MIDCLTKKNRIKVHFLKTPSNYGMINISINGVQKRESNYMRLRIN